MLVVEMIVRPPYERWEVHEQRQHSGKQSKFEQKKRGLGNQTRRRDAEPGTASRSARMNAVAPGDTLCQCDSGLYMCIHIYIYICIYTCIYIYIYIYMRVGRCGDPMFGICLLKKVFSPAPESMF